MSEGERRERVLAAGKKQLADCPAVIDMEMHIEERGCELVCVRVLECVRVCVKMLPNQSHLLKLHLPQQ